MIRINLLPAEFRIVEKKRGPAFQTSLPVFKIGVGTGVFIILLTVFFYVDFLFSSAKLGKLNSKWEQIQPQALKLNQLRAQVEEVLKPERDFILQYIQTPKPLTYLLMWASEFLPENAWLTELKLEHDDKGTHFLVRGLCLSTKDKSSIEQIEMFIQSLKAKLDTSQINLTTTRQNIKDIQLAQFTSIFTWQTDGD